MFRKQRTLRVIIYPWWSLAELWDDALYYAILEITGDSDD